jgi:hypothetical protein
MTAVTVTASCGGCDWTAAGPGSEWDAVQRQADKHTAAGHPVTVVAVPAARSERPASKDGPPLSPEG